MGGYLSWEPRGNKRRASNNFQREGVTPICIFETGRTTFQKGKGVTLMKNNRLREERGKALVGIQFLIDRTKRKIESALNQRTVGVTGFENTV